MRADAASELWLGNGHGRFLRDFAQMSQCELADSSGTTTANTPPRTTVIE